MIRLLIFTYLSFSTWATSEPRPCMDKAMNCAKPQVQEYCKEEKMFDGMKNMCAKTCGFCQDSNDLEPHISDEEKASAMANPDLPFIPAGNHGDEEAPERRQFGPGVLGPGPILTRDQALIVQRCGVWYTNECANSVLNPPTRKPTPVTKRPMPKGCSGSQGCGEHGHCDTRRNQCVCQPRYSGDFCQRFSGRTYYEYPKYFTNKQCARYRRSEMKRNPTLDECKLICDRSSDFCNAFNYNGARKLCQLMTCQEDTPYPAGVRGGLKGYSVKFINRPVNPVATESKLVFPETQKGANLRAELRLSCGVSNWNLQRPPQCVWETPQNKKLRMRDIKAGRIPEVGETRFGINNQCGITIKHLEIADIGLWRCIVRQTSIKRTRGVVRVDINDNDRTSKYNFREKHYRTSGLKQCVIVNGLRNLEKLKLNEKLNDKSPLEFCMEGCDADNKCNAFNIQPNANSCDLLQCSSPLPPPMGRSNNYHAYILKTEKIHTKRTFGKTIGCDNGIHVDELWWCDGENDCIDGSDEKSCVQ